jgi:hypothetical protein
MSDDMGWLGRRLPDYDLSRMQTPGIEVLAPDDFAQRENALLGSHGRHEQIEALYDPGRNALSFSDQFSEMTPSLRALLAHETTHAVQHANGETGPSREYEAYRVQQDWRRANGLPYQFPEEISQSLADIDQRNGIERSPAQRGIYRDGRITGFGPNDQGGQYHR